MFNNDTFINIIIIVDMIDYLFDRFILISIQIDLKKNTPKFNIKVNKKAEI